MALSKTAEFRLHVKRVEYRLVRGYLYPQPLLHNDLNTPICPEYSTNNLVAVGHFTGWNVQVVYSIRFVLGTLSRRSPATFGLPPDLREPSWFFGESLRLRVFGVTFNLRGPLVSSEDLRPHHLTFGRKGNLRVLETFGTFGFCPAV